MEGSNDSTVSIATRIALIELLTYGSVPDGASILGLKAPSKDDQKSIGQKIAPHQSVIMRMQEANTQLLQNVEKYKPIVQFVEDYRSNQPYLLPQISQTSSLPSIKGSEIESSLSTKSSSFKNDIITPQSIVSILLDAENDIKQLDRDLRSCEQFSQRQVAGAGKLADHEKLVLKLNLIKEQITQKLKTDEEIEQKALDLMGQYSTHIDTISRLFIHWDSMLTDIEDALTRLERRS